MGLIGERQANAPPAAAPASSGAGRRTWLNAMWSSALWTLPKRVAAGLRRPAGAAIEGGPACLQSIIDGVEDEAAIIGRDFTVKQANRTLLRRLGKPTQEVIGHPCFQAIRGAEAPCAPPWGQCPLGRIAETGDTVRSIRPESTGEDDRCFEVITAPVWDAQGNISEVIELTRDITETRYLRRAILRANRELLALNSIARSLSQSLDLKETLQAAAEAMLDALDAQLSWVRLSDDASRLPAVRASRGVLAQTSDELLLAMPDLAAGAETTSASYTVSRGDDGADGQALWQFAVTPLGVKGALLGTAGVATDRRPLDQQRIQLLEAIGKQLALAIERCRLYAEVQLARDWRGQLLQRLINAQEQERRRIARDLHDDTAQVLTALRLVLERLPGSDAASGSETARALAFCRQAEDGIDKIMYDLRPALLDDLGVRQAIEFYAQQRLEPAGVGLHITVTGEERRLPDEIEEAVFRVLQESVANVVKHARATRVAIRLEYNGGSLAAEVEDDGCGFDAELDPDVRHPRRGLGLIGMRERMGLIGGTLQVRSRPGAGTLVRATVPLPEGTGGNGPH